MLKNTTGTWIQIPSIEIVDIFTDTILDWVCFDLEHGVISDDFLRVAIPLVNAKGKLAAVRVLHSDRMTIRRYLDLGVDIIILPNVTSPSECFDLIKHLHYPPNGVRGIGFSRSNKYGEINSEALSKQPFLIAQIENVLGLENLPKLIDTNIFSGFMLGPYDLSGSLGVCGDFGNAKYKRALEQFTTICKSKDVLVGQHVVNLAQITAEDFNTFDFLAVGLDTDFVKKAASNISDLVKTGISR